MLIQNEYYEIAINGQDVLLNLKKSGYPLKSFDSITRQYPRIKISSFPALQKALTEVGEGHLIGNYAPLVEVDVSSDKMTAEAILNITFSEFDEKKEELLKEIQITLDDYGIIYGRLKLSTDDLFLGAPIVVAKGREPKKGKDAKITYIEKPLRKPVIREDGSADYYEMNFVTPISTGDWLGEKTEPTEGMPGMDIYGNHIDALKGEDAKLRYDRKSVAEVEEHGKIVLRALFGGALEFTEDDAVKVGKHLIINGDVGPETGSITFDGAVSVYGSVLAGYSVKAKGDISIEGNESVTNAKEICSSEGDLYIKGGVFGGDASLIEAGGDVYLKHANNCKLYGRNVNVGLYILGSDVVAENVFVDKNRGKIIGGRIEALYRIECAYAGNSHERSTLLIGKGIDKDLIYQDIQQMALELKELQKTSGMLESQLAQFSSQKQGTFQGEQAAAFEKLKELLDSSQVKMLELDRGIQVNLYKVKTAIPPKIEVAQGAYPGVTLQIGTKSSILTKMMKGVFEVVDNIPNF